MNTKLIIGIVAVFLGAIIAGIVWYVMSVPSVAPQTSVQQTTTLPISGSITPIGSPSSSATPSQNTAGITLTNQNGSVTAKDFIHNGVTIPDTVNAGKYLLAGNLGYCLSDPQKCQAGLADNFSVYYNSEQQSFIITLTEEPIGQARLGMEKFMLKTLGITEQQMCNLNYIVGVTKYVNSQYVGKNLGFSFCPGATKLPQ